MPGFPPSALRAFTCTLLEGLGVPKSDAATTADCLVTADMEGHGSHGLGRLPLYSRRLRDGLIDPRPAMRRVSELPAAVLLDGGNGLGPVVGATAMDTACEKAAATAVGLCAVFNSNHLGAMGWYVRRAAARGYVGLAFSNTPPALAAPGGTRPYLGTNPIAAGLPTEAEPVVVDMATSQVARGRLLAAAKAGRSIPAGWAFDADGRPTTDPQAGIEGTLAPLGGPKGFALALAVEALTGVLAGAAVGPEVGGTYISSERPSNLGQSFIAIDAARLQPAFRQRMTRLVSDLRSEDAVRLPGERSAAERSRSEATGVELSDELIEELNELAAAAGVPTL